MLICDFLRPEVNATVVLTERIVLLRLEDAGEDGKHLLRIHGALEWLVVDVAHAVHIIPIRPSERQFMCGQVGSWCVVFKVFGMGGKSSLRIWGRFAADTGRGIVGL